MRHERERWMAGVAVGLLALTACSEVTAADPESEGDTPAVVEPVEGSDGLSRITLSEHAVERLDLATAAVAESSAGGAESTIPYGAVIYDADGSTWAYTEVQPLVYLREAITVAAIKGDLATLQAGPPVGTPVVSVGSAELYGAELGVDH